MLMLTGVGGQVTSRPAKPAGSCPGGFLSWHGKPFRGRNPYRGKGLTAMSAPSQLRPDSVPLLTVREVAAELRLSQSAVYSLVRAGGLNAIRIGPRSGAIRIPRAALDDYRTGAETHERPQGLPKIRSRNGLRLPTHLDVDRLHESWSRQGGSPSEKGRGKK